MSTTRPAQVWQREESDKREPDRFLKYFVEIANSLREPVLLIDDTFRIVTTNNSFCRTFGVEPSATKGAPLFQLGNRQWDTCELRELLKSILSRRSDFSTIDVEYNFTDIGRKTLHLNVRNVARSTMKSQLLFIAIKDVDVREADKTDLENLVQKRTNELILAGKEAEKGKQLAEKTLAEIQNLKTQLEAERSYLQQEIKLKYDHESIIGQSSALQHVLYQIEQIAGSNTTVLVLGETGTGKELAVRAIHNLGPCKQRALIKINCATLPENLIESELFGHEKGAFTDSQSKHLGRFEVANGSTIFLDEIGELPLDLQAKLLRVVQDGEFERLGGSRTIKVNTRIIAATNRDLKEDVRKGTFREDLWYRLNVFPITLPPLRDRREDIPLLVSFYLQKIASKMRKSIEVVPESVMEDLMNYDWPGNIRELENVIERAVIESTGPKLHLADKLKKVVVKSGSTPKTLEAIQKQHILGVLQQTGWKVSGKGSAAEILGLNRSTLRARMRKLNLLKP